jgi:hypothetical protein
MWKLGMALGLCSLAGCGGAMEAAPPVERFAVHQGPLWPAGTSGSTLVDESKPGFLAYGVASDGTIVFRVSGTAGELGAFKQAVVRETGMSAERCWPSPPTGDIATPGPCPPGPTGGGPPQQQ